MLMNTIKIEEIDEPDKFEEINRCMPHKLCFERPEEEDTSYGG